MYKSKHIEIKFHTVDNLCEKYQHHGIYKHLKNCISTTDYLTSL